MTRATMTVAILLGALATSGSISHAGDKSVGLEHTGPKNKGYVIQSIGSNDGRTVVRAQPRSDTMTWNSQVNDGEHVYELRIEDGTIVLARIDGKDLGKDRIREENGVVVFLSEDGKILYEFKSAPVARTWVVDRLDTTRVDAPQIRVTSTVERPKTMLGLYQSEVPDAVAEHLGIEGDAIMIESVIPGLPADKHGLRANDVIVSIDGSDSMSSSGLTKVLRAKEPGDAIEIVVIRKGERRTIEVELAAYDAEALGNTSFGITVSPTKAPGAPRLPATGLWIGEQGRALREQAMTEIERSLHQHGLTNEQIAEVESAVRESLKALEESVRDAIDTGAAAGNRMGELGRDMRARVRDDIMNTLRASGLGEDDADDVDRAVRQSLHTIEESIRAATESMEQQLARFPRVDPAERHAMLEEMKRKAEAAMRQAERQVIELRDGRLTLRNQAEDIEREFFELAKQLEGRGAGMTEELDERLSALEARLDELDGRLDRIVDMFEGFADRIAEKIDAQDED